LQMRAIVCFNFLALIASFVDTGYPAVPVGSRYGSDNVQELA
jgi:hypothetical protein